MSKTLRYLGAAMLGSTLVMALTSPPARDASGGVVQTDPQARSMVDGKL